MYAIVFVIPYRLISTTTEIPENWKDRWLNVLYANSDGNNCDEFVGLVSYYKSSLGVSGFLAGFEFLGLSGIEIDDDTAEIVAFLMTLTFVFAIVS